MVVDGVKKGDSVAKLTGSWPGTTMIELDNGVDDVGAGNEVPVDLYEVKTVVVVDDMRPGGMAEGTISLILKVMVELDVIAVVAAVVQVVATVKVVVGAEEDEEVPRSTPQATASLPTGALAATKLSTVQPPVHGSTLQQPRNGSTAACVKGHI